MSASRKCLLAAALCGAMTPTASTWAQGGAYGAESIVEHNDLRWFEPVELDIDGQMPHRSAGWFATIDKLYWATGNPKVEVGEAGKTVDSERIYPAPSNDLAFTALQQIEALDFIDNLQENLSYIGIEFVIANTRGTASLTDDIKTPFNTQPYTTVAELDTAITAFNNDPANQANNLLVRVGGEPTPYQVRNSIRDAMPDAGWAWGERYSFGYSDGEQGWMIEVLDGPESNAGGVWGVPHTPYTSQSETAVPGPDPDYAADLTDDDGDGMLDGDGPSNDLFALGFGSVAVNFNLPTPDFLSGYRDYFNNSTGAAGGTQTGPIMYIGNYGAFEDDTPPFDIGNNPGATVINVQDALTAIATYDLQASDPPTVNPNETILNQQINLILADVNQALTVVGNLEDDENLVLDQLAVNVINAVALLQAAQNALANANAGMVPPNQLDPQITAVANSLAAFNTALAGIVLAVEDGDGQDGQTDLDTRLADDLDGNGQAGTFTVLADIDGDGVIEPGEIIAIINNYGDLHTFNVFFDQVTIRNRTEIDGVELMRMHDISTRHKMEQGRFDDMRFTYGVRFLQVKDDFYFQGTGSILGRTSVDTDAENQIVGPQIGLKWTRVDGPWDFSLEARGMAGYNIVDVDQYGVFGEEAIPGALNRSASARTTTSVDGDRYDEFSPIGELRAQLKYRLADSISLQAGYTAKFVGNIHRGSTATAWNAPDFGIYDRKGDLFTNGLNLGVEFRH
jgi:hypothetical protein